MASRQLDVECALATGTTTPQRDHVLNFLAATLLVRRYADQRKQSSRASDKRTAQYQRWPKKVTALRNRSLTIRFVRPTGNIFSKKIQPGDVLHNMKLNVEAIDACSRLVDAALEGFFSQEDLMFKAYVAIRTYSSQALECPAWHTQWTSGEDGVSKLLREAPATRDAKPLRSSSAVMFNLCNGALASANFGAFWCYNSREQMLEQLLALPALGSLSCKNLFHVLRRHDPEATTSPAANRGPGARSDAFAITSVGARFALNWLLREPGGRRFCAEAASLSSFRHFSAKLGKVKNSNLHLLCLERHVRGFGRTILELADIADRMVQGDGGRPRLIDRVPLRASNPEGAFAFLLAQTDCRCRQRTGACIERDRVLRR
eukprot:s56_g27.t1